MAKTKKKKINFKGLLVVILILYLIGMLIFYMLNLHIKNIVIEGTKNVSDIEIIEAAHIKNYPSIFKLNTIKMKKRVKDIDLVDNVKIRRTLTGKIIFKVTEAKPLFLDYSKNKIVLSNRKEIEYSDKYLGLPVLVNYVPSDILKEFIKRFSKIDADIISLISEIEYSPERLDDIMLNENRFVLRMNDSNTVYVDTINLKKLNNYMKLYATISGDERGIFHLDSNSSNISFNTYEEESVEENELQQSDEGNN